MDPDSLRQIESLASLSPSQLAQASRRLVWRRYSAGELIVPHQARIQLDGIVYRGSVQVSVVRRGRWRIVGYVHAQAPINCRLTARDSLPVELRAAEATILCLLPKDDVQPAAPLPVPADLRRQRDPALGTIIWLLATAVLVVLTLLYWPSIWRIPSSKVTYGLASCLLQDGRYVAASRLLKTSIELNPRLDIAYNDLGYIFYRRGWIEQAQATLRQAVAADPTSAIAHNNLGLIYLETGELTLAHEALQHAVTLNPESAAAWTNLGVAAHRLNRPEDALYAYRAALRLDPHNVVVQVNLGILYYEQERLPEAQSQLQAALDVHPYLPYANAIQGAIALNAGEYDKAKSELELARPALQEDPLYRFYLALWSKEAGNWSAAEAELNEALALDPDPALAALIRSHLAVLYASQASLPIEETKGE